MSNPSEDLPRHVAIIMDGNGRWAKRHNLPRIEGHRRGRGVVKRVVRWSSQLGIEYLTLYAFSTENWRRPKSEVVALMEIFDRVLDEEVEELHKNGVRMRFIGGRRKLSAKLQKKMRQAEEKLAKNRGLKLQVALNYGGREELLHACQALFQKKEFPRTLSQLESCLYTKGIPDPDLLIRTAGEYRTSNFLLYQSAYTEFYFCQVLWPDFTLAHFRRALKSYARRVRRFGSVR